MARWHLEPGQSVSLREWVSLRCRSLVTVGAQEQERPLRSRVQAHRYFVRYWLDISFGDPAHASDDWQGTLFTGERKIILTPAPEAKREKDP